jgi:hypothetical protein
MDRPNLSASISWTMACCERQVFYKDVYSMDCPNLSASISWTMACCECQVFYKDVYSMDCPNLSASISWTMACCVRISEERCATERASVTTWLSNLRKKLVKNKKKV